MQICFSKLLFVDTLRHLRIVPVDSCTCGIHDTYIYICFHTHRSFLMAQKFAPHKYVLPTSMNAYMYHVKVNLFNYKNVKNMSQQYQAPPLDGGLE